MHKFEIRLQELGLDVNDLSIRLKNDISEFYSLSEFVNGLGNNYTNLVDDVEKEKYHSAFQNLQIADEELVYKIDKFNRNKDGYKERAIKMQEARGLKRENEDNQYNFRQQEQHKNAPKEQEQTNFTEQVEIKKKKNDTAFWILAGIVGVITLGSVMMNKNK
jgi:hypothetical protein